MFTRESVCNRPVDVDYGYGLADCRHIYGDFSCAHHVTLYTVFLRGYWRYSCYYILLRVQALKPLHSGMYNVGVD